MRRPVGDDQHVKRARRGDPSQAADSAFIDGQRQARAVS
jgi:hypothetical protein